MSPYVSLRMVCLASLAALSGCGGSDPPEVPISDQNIRRIGEAYAARTREKGPPANLDDLKPYLAKHGDVDKLLKSENDAQDFVILYGVNPKTYADDKKPIPITVHEKTGKGGKRLVFQGAVFRLTDEEFKKAPFPTGKGPS